MHYLAWISLAGDDEHQFRIRKNHVLIVLILWQTFMLTIQPFQSNTPTSSKKPTASTFQTVTLFLARSSTKKGFSNNSNFQTET